MSFHAILEYYERKLVADCIYCLILIVLFSDPYDFVYDSIWQPYMRLSVLHLHLYWLYTWKYDCIRVINFYVCIIKRWDCKRWYIWGKLSKSRSWVDTTWFMFGVSQIKCFFIEPYFGDVTFKIWLWLMLFPWAGSFSLSKWYFSWSYP